MIKRLSVPAPHSVTVRLTPFQWRIVRASAKRHGVKAGRFQEHAAYLLQEHLSDAVEGGGFHTGPVGYRPRQWDARARRETASARAKFSRYSRG